jgi:hypothetical protein
LARSPWCRGDNRGRRDGAQRKRMRSLLCWIDGFSTKRTYGARSIPNFRRHETAFRNDRNKQVAEKRAQEFIQEKEGETAGILEPKVIRAAAVTPLATHLEDSPHQSASRREIVQGWRAPSERRISAERTRSSFSSAFMRSDFLAWASSATRAMPRTPPWGDIFFSSSTPLDSLTLPPCPQTRTNPASARGGMLRGHNGSGIFLRDGKQFARCPGRLAHAIFPSHHRGLAHTEVRGKDGLARIESGTNLRDLLRFQGGWRGDAVCPQCFLSLQRRESFLRRINQRRAAKRFKAGQSRANGGFLPREYGVRFPPLC